MNNDKILSVSELTRKIRNVIESSFVGVTVQGEISNFKCHTSGHFYFTLKDEHTQIQAVMWRNRTGSLFFTPQDGMNVIVRGNVTVYEVRGQYQIDVFEIVPRGIGELQLAFEKLKQKLAAEGLFDKAHKKPLPRYPRYIGIVTSLTGAAVRDIINVLSRRFPFLEIIIYSVKVQGEGAAQEIAQAIQDLNKIGGIDLMIVGRGGGSLEDLWAFNEEIVARAIYNSRIPVVSAVGHEIDYTIADFVADFRAPTPSAAAELIVPDYRELIEYIRNFCYNSEQLLGNAVTTVKQKIASLLESYAFNRPKSMVEQYNQRVDELQRSLQNNILHKISIFNEKCNSLQQRLFSLNPDSVLKRGYAIVFREKRVVDSVKKLQPENIIQIHFHDGDTSAEVKKRDK